MLSSERKSEKGTHDELVRPVLGDVEEALAQHLVGEDLERASAGGTSSARARRRERKEEGDARDVARLDELARGQLGEDGEDEVLADRVGLDVLDHDGRVRVRLVGLQGRGER